MAQYTLDHLKYNGSDDIWEITDSAARGSLAVAYSASSTYAVGDIVLKDGQLYECNTAISTAEAWTAAHWTAVTVGEKVADLKAETSSLKEDFSDLDESVFPEISVTTTAGYIAGNGAISPAGAETQEVYSDYFAVTPNEVITFVIGNDEKKNVWAAVGLRTADNAWIRRDTLASGTTASGRYDYTVPDGVSLLAYTYRTYGGAVTTSAKRNSMDSISEDIAVLRKEAGFVAYDSDYGIGYFSGSGEIVTPTAKSEIYTETYIPVVGGETLTATINLTATKDQWARWVFYDSNKSFMSYGTQPNTSGRTITIPIEVPKGASYMRISFRSYDALASLVIGRNVSAFEAVVNYGNIINDSIIKYNKNCIFVAHQGYDSASTGTESGHNKLEGYYAAAQHGYDAGETDIKFTSDSIPVCSHDDSFTDATSGETVVIASSTFAELQTHNFYGSKIASFEQVLRACKNTGLILFIDQLSGATPSQLQTVIDLVIQYAMQDKVFWIFAPSADANVQTVLTAMPNTGIEVLSSTASSSDLIAYGNNIVTDKNTVYVAVNYASVTYDTVKQLALTLDSRAKMAVWTIPEWIPTCLNYMQYVGAITTNRTAYNDIYKYGIT